MSLMRTRLLILLLIALLWSAPGWAQGVTINMAPNLGTFQTGELQFPLTASGGNGSYSWSLTAGSLPPGLALRTDVPYYFDPSSQQAGLIGVATAAGNYTFSLTVTSNGMTATQSFMMRITALTVPEQYFNLADGFVGSPYSLNLTPLNNSGAATFTPTYNLPPGLSLSPGGLISGIPAQSGSYFIGFSLADSVDTVFGGVQLNIYDVQITSPGQLPNATQNAPYSYSLAASGGSGAFTYTSYSMPAGLTLSADGSISGTVTQVPGNWGINVTVTDSNQLSYTKLMSIDVVGAPPNGPGIQLQGPVTDCAVGVSCGRIVSVGYGGVAPFTWAATGLPAGLSLRFGPGAGNVYPGQAEVFGVPSSAGIYNVEFTVTDANNNSTSEIISLNVSNLWVDYGVPTATIGVPYSYSLRVLGGTGPYTVTLNGGRFPSGLSLAGLLVSGTPAENGYFSLGFTFQDSVGNSLFQSTSLSVLGVPQPGGGNATIQVETQFLPTPLPIVLGSPFSYNLFACCVPSYTWSVAPGSSLPQGINLLPTGILTGTATTAGFYSFLVQAADASNPANYGVGQVTINVVASLLGITSPSGVFVDNVGVSLPFANVGTGYGPVVFTAIGGTGPLTWSVASSNYLPPGLTFSGDGVLSGTPTATGFYVFSIAVTDSAGQTARTTFNLSVYAAGAVPPLNLTISPSFGPSIVGVLQIPLTASGGHAPYHFSLSPGATPIPGMRVQDGQPLPPFFSQGVGGFIGVITNPGTYNTSIRVTDSSGNVFDKPVTITVANIAMVSQTFLPNATEGVPYAFSLVAYGGSGNYAFISSALPQGLSLTSTGEITGIPSVHGSFFVSLTLEDLATAQTAFSSLQIVVDPFAITTNGVLPPATVGVPYSQALSAPNCGSNCVWSATGFFGSIAPGLSISSSGILSGTPTSTFVGSFTLKASGSNGTVQKLFSLTVASPIPLPLTINSAPIAPTTIGSFAALQLAAGGGKPPYSWSVQSGTLPPGISLVSPGEEYGANLAPGFAYLSGRVMQVGAYTFTLQLTDTSNNTTSETVTWSVSPISLGYFGLPLSGTSLVVNVSYSQPLLAMGGTGTYTWTALTSMPPGLSLNAATGVISGTPANTGSFFVTVQATDTNGASLTGSLFINITSPTGTVINFGVAGQLPNVQQGSSVFLALNLSGGTQPYTVTVGPNTFLPPGFSVEGGSSVLGNGSPGQFYLAGSPLATGTFTFNLVATDAAGDIGVRTFTITVAPITILSQSLPPASVGTAYSSIVTTFDNAGTVSWFGVPFTLPPGLHLSSGGVLSGTPTQAGTFNFTLTATDVSGISINYAFSLAVSSITILSPGILTPSATAGVPYAFTFTASGGGSSKTWSVAQLGFPPAFLPPGLTLSPTGVLSGTPFLAGVFTLNVTVSDGSSSLTQVFTFIVNPPNPPLLSVTNPNLVDIPVDQLYSISLTASGGVPPYTWSLAPGSLLPPGMNLLTGSSVPANFAPGTTLFAGVPSTPGTYTFDLIVTDSSTPAHAQVRRTFSLHVSALNVLGLNPGFGLALKAGTTGVAYSQQLTAVGGTPPYAFTMSPASLTQDLLPPGLTLSPTGMISGTPTSTGFYTFILNVQDSAGHTLSRSTSLSVTNPGGWLIFNSNPLDLNAGSGISTTLSVSGPSSRSFTWSLLSGPLPAGLNLTPNGTLSGVINTPGTHTFTVRGTDTLPNSANTVDHTFTYSASPMQIVATPYHGATSPNILPAGSVGTPYSFTFNVAGGAPPYTFMESPFLALPPGLTLSPAGVLSGTPSSSGIFSIQPIVTDSNNAQFNGFSYSVAITPSGTPNPLTAATQITIPTSIGAELPLEVELIPTGGVPPVSYSVTSGTLPQGLAIFPGANGVSSFLAGTPQTPGTYTFTLVATDSAGQTASQSVSQVVSPVSVGPWTVAPAILKGPVHSQPYSVTFMPAGGTAPYTFALSSGSDMPIGMTLSSNGILSGIPAYPGSYAIQFTVSDSAGHMVNRSIVFEVDNVAGQVPVLTVAPEPIQIVYIQGSNSGPIPISVDTSSGNLPFTAAFSGIPGSLSSSNGVTSSAVNLTLNAAGLPAGVYEGLFGVSAPGSVNRSAAAPVTLTVEPAPPCTYSLLPNTGSAAIAGGTGTFAVSTGPLCNWSAMISDPSWLSITAGASGSGPGTVNYTVAANATGNARSATIGIADQVYTIQQFGPSCSFSVSPATLSASASGGSAALTINASDAGCSWTASGLGASPASGMGNGTVTLTIPQNTAASSQTLSATVATQPIIITQAAANCIASLNSPAASLPSSGGPGSVNITMPAGCNYSTVPGPSWITIASGSSGGTSGTLTFTVATNSTTFSRSGILTIGGQPFEIDQAALACSVTVDGSFSGSPYGVSGGNNAGVISVNANAANCSWLASSNAPWITLDRNSGTGNGTLNLSVLSNAASTASRSAMLTIAGQNLTVTQSGTTCTFTLGSPSGSVPSSGGAGSVGVIAPAACGWGSSSNNPDWLSITSSGMAGSSDVDFVAQPNPGPASRTGTLTVAGFTYTVTQNGGTCPYTLSTSAITVAPGGGSGSFGLTAPTTGCSPSALSFTGWITVSTAFSGKDGSVRFMVAPNAAGTTRTGVIEVGDQDFTITQTGAPCAFSLFAYGQAFGQAGGDGAAAGPPTALGCTPSVTTNQPGFITLGSLSGPAMDTFTQPYTVAPFISINPFTRFGTINFGGQVYTIKQNSW